MWSSIILGLKELGSLWLKSHSAKVDADIALRRKRAESEVDWDTAAQLQAQYSWKDELITIIWFSPLVVAWFYPERARKWVDWVADLPHFYQIGMFGIIAASFGLRWFFKQQGASFLKKNAETKS